MASAFSHAIVALAMGKAFENKELSWRELFLGALCSVVPDFDVIGLYIGIQYGDVWGHRGLTHSIMFAVLLAASLVAVWYRGKDLFAMTGLFLGGFKFQVQRVNEGAIAHRLPGASQSRDIFVGAC